MSSPPPTSSSLAADPPDAALLGQLQTEGLDAAWAGRIDTLATADLCAEFLQHEAAVPPAIAASLPTIAALVDALVKRIQAGGRLFYVGAGNSGRVAHMDSTELQPTFSVDPSQFQALVAGGSSSAVAQARENAEDIEEDGAAALQALQPTPLDSVIGISASGRTPYVLGALRLAQSTGALTAGITNCHPSAFDRLGLQYLVTLLTGPEFLSGSTRLKAGTAAKQVLNMISTCTMVQLGKTYRGLMLDVQVRNNKLRVRGRRIFRQICGTGPAYLLLQACAGEFPDTASLEPRRLERLLDASDADIDTHIRLCENSVKLACAVAVSGLDLATARARLESVNGHFHRFLQLPIQQASSAVQTAAGSSAIPDDLVLVVDGGGTHCKVTVAARSGEVAHGETGACNINGVTPDELVAQIRESTLQAVTQLRNARLAQLSHLHGGAWAQDMLSRPVTMPRFARVWAGIAGLHYSFNPAALTARLETLFSVSVRDGSLRLTSDSILLAACISADKHLQGGLAVLSGTGSVSVAFRRSPQQNGEVVYAGRAGGWGHLLGDHGSAFDIGKRALQAILSDMETRAGGSAGPHEFVDDEEEEEEEKKEEADHKRHTAGPSSLETAVLSSLGATARDTLSEGLLPRILHSAGHEPKNQIAEVARVVTALAFPGHDDDYGPAGRPVAADQQALSILEDAVGDFVDQIKPLVLSRKCKPECDALLLSGSMFNLEPYRNLFFQAWEKRGLPAYRKTIVVDKVSDWGAAHLLRQLEAAAGGGGGPILAAELEGVTENFIQSINRCL